jgi:predicted O-methyltransferase YrrM
LGDDFDVTAASTEARARKALGDLSLAAPAEQAAHAAWVDGFGIVTPEVARYADVLRDAPDAVQLAMRNVAATDGIDVLDPDAATLIGVLARSHHPRRVLEVGTGVGLVTLHLARNVPEDCVVTSVEQSPRLQGQAHAFLEHVETNCAVELRLGTPQRVLRDADMREGWDMVVLSDPTADRLELLDTIAPYMSRDCLLLVPFALRGGRVAHGVPAWDEPESIEQQRMLNRRIAGDAAFTDVTLLSVGDGLLIARRAH